VLDQQPGPLLHPVSPEPEKKTYFLETFFPCDPRRWMHRYFMLLLMCFLSFGSYYVYDNPAALQRTIMNVRAMHGFRRAIGMGESEFFNKT